MASYDIPSLYVRFFGHIGFPYSKLSVDRKVTDADAFDAQEDNAPRAEESGVLGVPIHMPCKLGDYRLPNEPLIELSTQRRIVMTDIDGNDGSFKELYSNGDYQVTIRGVLIDDEDPEAYPEDQVRALRNVLEERKHVAIANRLTAMFNIEHVAIESYSFPAGPGELGMQPYEIRALSDREFALNLRES